MITLAEALTQQLVTVSTWDGHVIYICAVCGAYLCWSHNPSEKIFSCSCHDDKLEPKGGEEKIADTMVTCQKCGLYHSVYDKECPPF